jgi:glycolate oxidase iron-sulfur subunit
VMEGHAPTRHTQLHLDRCLTCRNCETTCPSGVEYGKLVDIGRELVEQRVARPAGERLFRKLLLSVLPYPGRFTPLLRLGQLVRPLLPGALRAQVPPRVHAGTWPEARHARRMLVLDGCVQPGIDPGINAATARILDRIGISLVRTPDAGCCGAVSHHLNATDEAHATIKRLINAWWPEVEQGAEAIVITASGCGAMVKEYGYLLRDDPDYADKAARVSALARDISEVLDNEQVDAIKLPKTQRVAFHPPCTLQHGQKLRGKTEQLLGRLGFELVPVTDGHLCCGSAGTYSLLQPELSTQLRDNKLHNLLEHKPERIVTANIGCQTHLAAAAGVPVQHWISVLDVALSRAGG